MPPKKRATRASKRTADAPDVAGEPAPKKQTRRRARKSANSTQNSIIESPNPAAKKKNIPVVNEPQAAANETPVSKAEQKTQPSKAQTKKDQKRHSIAQVTTGNKTPPPKDRSTSPKNAEFLLDRLASPSKKPVLQSPAKRPTILPKADPLDTKKAEAVINKTFLLKDVPKLTSIIEDLKTTRAEQIFNEFRASAEVRFQTSDDLVSSLTQKNQSLAAELELLKNKLTALENREPGPEDQSFEHQLILDMMEQIVGLRLHRVEDTEESLSFDCSQSGKNGVLDYKLTIPKIDSSEIIYTPMNSEDEIPHLEEYLPDYFFDNLTFPLDTLQQFYHKIYRGLNK